MLDAAARLRPGGTVVATFVLLDRAVAAYDLLGAMVQVHVDRCVPIGTAGGAPQAAQPRVRLLGRAMTVFLVGAGPGDPQLLTVRAAALIAAADVLVHDRLVSAEILDLAPASAVRIDVSSAPGTPWRDRP